MKVVSSQQMYQMESEAYRGGASESDFMEEAGSGVALVVHDYAEALDLDKHIILLCGKGNNAGDAYVAGIHLLHLEYHVVAYQCFSINDSSHLCKENHFRFIQEGGIVKEISSAEEINYPPSGVIVDGLFGTGFRGEVKGPIASIIKSANCSQLPIIAVDIPSGLNGETGEAASSCIIATETAFLGLPKMGFFLRNGWNHVGNLVFVDFGLPKEYIDKAESALTMLSPDMLKPLLPLIVRNRHKYQAGYVVNLAGSRNMPGAAILSSLAALSSGAGIVRLLYPEDMEMNLVAGPLELLRMPYAYDTKGIEIIVETMNQASATLVGPGLGVTPETRKMLREVMPRLTKPCVIDADALTIMAEEKIPFPANTILTPHTGEIRRLLQVDYVDLEMDFFKKCQVYATEQRVTLVLKGGPTFIFHPNQTMQVNPRGDPGMATAGSGDVLTGILASLMAQGLSPQNAAALGVYLHGVSGEFAAGQLTSYCMLASDIINYLPDAFRPINW
jgi:hydroxyethylthiazole kinase-like uncharacterized protein yjeF